MLFCRFCILCFAAAGIQGSTTHPSFSKIPSPSPSATKSLSPFMEGGPRRESPQSSSHYSFPRPRCTRQGRWRRDRGQYYSALAARGSCSIRWLRYQCHLPRASLRVRCVMQPQQNEVVTRSSHRDWHSSRLLPLPSSTRCSECELGNYTQYHSMVMPHILQKSFIFGVTSLDTSWLWSITHLEILCFATTFWSFLPCAT